MTIGRPGPDKTQTLSKDKSSGKPIAKHWAFKAIKNPSPIPASADNWVRTNIDRFVLAKMKEAKLSPARPASRRDLIRRLYFNLLGLPPSYKEGQQFIHASNPMAYENLVEKLLSSPSFGERWARHWLDIARYSDTKGYVFEESREYPYAYSYRDWVINSLNEDLPYNSFLLYQLAADKIVKGEENKKHLAAMGFLTVGRRFLNREPDIIDDRIDVTFRGTMGLTVACSRCHDHKYDPIPTTDYYSLYGVFDSSKEPSELPLLGPPSNPKLYKDFEDAVNAKQKEIDSYLDKRSKELTDKKHVKRYLLAATEGKDLGTEELKKLASSRGLLHKPTIQWRNYLRTKESNSDSTYIPWFEFSAIPKEKFTGSVPSVWQKLEASGKPINPTLITALKGTSLKKLDDVAEIYARIFTDPGTDQDFSKELEHAKVSADSIYPLLETAGQQHVRKLRRNLADVRVKHPGAPPKGMVLVDRPSPREPQVFKRGNPSNRGQKVKRQFLGFLEGKNRKPFTNGSGRLEMAAAITNNKNPLTARVWVNRVWGHLIGSHLVSTPSDFGLRSDPPTHPMLLDYLAYRFINEGWSTKKLIRSILLSSTYRQSSIPNENHRLHNVDPENRLLTRANRRRLDFEAFRDGLLSVSGQLDPEMFGRPVEISTKEYSRRRTIYARIERQNLPPVFRTFDFASPDVHIPKRPETTVPQQALYFLNGKFVQDQASALVSDSSFTNLSSNTDRITLLYRKIFSRDPSKEEIKDGLSYIKLKPNPENNSTSSWEQYSQALLSTNEFAFVD